MPVKPLSQAQAAVLGQARQVVTAGAESTPGEALGLQGELVDLVDVLRGVRVRPGPRQAMSDDQLAAAREMYQARAEGGGWKFTVDEIAAEYGQSRDTIYRRVVAGNVREPGQGRPRGAST